MAKENSMKILVLGAGGIGGYFGARLLNAGADLSFPVGEDASSKAVGMLTQAGSRLTAKKGSALARPMIAMPPAQNSVSMQRNYLCDGFNSIETGMGWD